MSHKGFHGKGSRGGSQGRGKADKSRRRVTGEGSSERLWGRAKGRAIRGDHIGGSQGTIAGTENKEREK